MDQIRSDLNTDADLLHDPSRWGERREFFRAPRHFGAPLSLRNTEKVFQMAYFLSQICIKSIFGQPWTLPRELTMLSIPFNEIVRGTPLPIWSPSMPSVSRFWRLCNEIVIGSHKENGLVVPAVTLGGPGTIKVSRWSNHVRWHINQE